MPHGAWKEVEVNQIAEIIDALPSRKAPGPDGVTKEVLKCGG